MKRLAFAIGALLIVALGLAAFTGLVTLQPERPPIVQWKGWGR